MLKDEKKPIEQEQPNLQVTELQKALQALQEQNKQLLEQSQQAKLEQEKAKKAAEEAAKKKEKADLENDTDLAKLLKGLEEPPEEKKKSARSVDALSNEELLGVMSGAVETFVDAKLKIDKEEREASQDGFLKKLGNVENMLGHMMAVQSVNGLQAKYPDFNTYREDIAKIIQETPGLSVEKAYKLAKAERLDKEPALAHVETEMPDIGPNGLPALRRRESKDDENKKTNNAGLGNFRSLLSEGIARAVANRSKS